MSKMLSSSDRRRQSAARHAKRVHHCLCGKVVRGNAYTNHARRCVRNLSARRYRSEGGFRDYIMPLSIGERFRLMAAVPAPVSRCPVSGSCRNWCDCPSCATWTTQACKCYRCGTPESPSCAGRDRGTG